MARPHFAGVTVSSVMVDCYWLGSVCIHAGQVVGVVCVSYAYMRCVGRVGHVGFQ